MVAVFASQSNYLQESNKSPGITAKITVRIRLHIRFL